MITTLRSLAPLPLLSVGLHVCAALALIVAPSSWPWAVGAVIANHLLLTVLSLMPRGRWLGPNLSRLPVIAVERRAVAITIDDGPDPAVTPRVLDILDSYSAKATFFCIGCRVRAHPTLTAEMIRRGHAIENHSESHRWHFALMGIGGFAREIGSAQQSIAAVTGETPRYFRAPAGIRSPLLDPALRRLGLTLASWTRRGFDTVERDADKVLRRLSTDLRPGDILLLHDGHAAMTRGGTPVILEVLPRLLDTIGRAGLTTVTLRSMES